MRISARNCLHAKVKMVVEGALNREVLVELPGGQEMVAVITKTSVESLGIAPGKDVYVVVKASNVMLGVD